MTAACMAVKAKRGHSSILHRRNRRPTFAFLSDRERGRGPSTCRDKRAHTKMKICYLLSGVKGRADREPFLLLSLGLCPPIACCFGNENDRETIWMGRAGHKVVEVVKSEKMTRTKVAILNGTGRGTNKK